MSKNSDFSLYYKPYYNLKSYATKIVRTQKYYYNSTIYIQKSYNFITLLFNTRPLLFEMASLSSFIHTNTQFYAYYLIYTSHMDSKQKKSEHICVWIWSVLYMFCMGNMKNNVKIMFVKSVSIEMKWYTKKIRYPWKFKFFNPFFSYVPIRLCMYIVYKWK